ncbi:MAG: SH3 domain-containing protein [Patescibacteria group bacterium]
MNKKLIAILTVTALFIAVIIVGISNSGGDNFLTNLLKPFNKSRAGLQVITNETNVSLFLNGEYLDKAPYINRNIKPGIYTLRIQPDDTTLIPYEAQIQLSKGLLTVVTWKPGQTAEMSGGVIYELEPLPSKKQAEVSFITIPDNAIITFDNQEQQFSPLTLTDLAAGRHEYQVSLPSFETQKHTINIVAGHRLNVSIKLAKNNNVYPSATPTEQPSDDQESSPAAEITGPSDLKSRIGTSSATTSDIPASYTGPRIQILSTKYYDHSKEVLKVRDSASSSGKELGFAEVGKDFIYLGESDNGWYKIDFNGQEGWVSAQYSKLLGD